MKTKLLSLFVALFATTALWAYDFKYGGIGYNITSESDKTVEVTYENKRSPSSGNYRGLTSASIPASVTTFDGTTYSVTSIGSSAFEGCTGLTYVTIPNSVTYIGDYAFNCCRVLTSVIIGDSVASIGERGFQDCSNLTSITIPNSVTSIGSNAFHGCTGLTSITIPNGVTSIEYGAFSDCTGLTSATIPNSVTEIGSYAFSDCTGFTSVTIPNSVTYIGERAFEGCTGLTSVEWNAKSCKFFPNFEMGISQAPFYKSSQITSFIFGNEVVSIPSYLCSGLNNLTSITIPNSVTSIGESAFSSCTGLPSISIPSSVASIGKSAFSGCTNLTSITISEGVMRIDDHAFANCVNISSISIPNSVTYLSGFDGLKYITSIVIPNSVDTIGNYAFDHCISLASITWGNGVKTIGSNAFANCADLRTITIPDHIINIKDKAFYDCDGITSVAIGAKVDSIGDEAFYGCEGLTSVSFGNSVLSIGNSTFSNCEGLTSVIIPNSVTNIGELAFAGCSGLTSISIGSSVAHIGTYAFANCENLTETRYAGDVAGWMSIDFGHDVNSYDASNPVCHSRNLYINDMLLTHLNVPQDITKVNPLAFIGDTCLTSVYIHDDVDGIGAAAFFDCSNLVDARIGNNVASIGAKAFAGCDLTSVTIPENVAMIGDGAFRYNNHLTRVRWNAQQCTNSFSSSFRANNLFYNRIVGEIHINTTIQEFVFGDKVNHIPAGLCSHMSTITSIDIPESVTIIGERAFYQCDSLTMVSIGNHVDSIGNKAFAGCKKLNSIIWNATNYTENPFDNSNEIDVLMLGSNVRAIPGDMIGNNVKKMVIKAKMPPIVEGSFRGHPYYSTIYIPCATKPRYTSDERWGVWGKYYDYEEIPATTLSVLVRNAAEGQAIVTENHTCDDDEARISATPNAHYHFVQWSDGNTDNPRSVFVTSDTCFVAEFESDPQYIVTILCDSLRGYTTGAGAYYADEEATISATAYDGFVFAQWSDGNTDNPRTIIVTSDTILTAEFEKIKPQYYVSVEISCDEYGAQHGFVEGSGQYSEGDFATISATAYEGYEFKQWWDSNNGDTIMENPYTFVVTDDITFHAEFVPASAVDNITSDADVTTKKLFRDGKLFIIRGRRMYDALGNEITDKD